MSGSEEESGSEEDVMAKRAPAHTKGELEKHRVTQVCQCRTLLGEGAAQ